MSPPQRGLPWPSVRRSSTRSSSVMELFIFLTTPSLSEMTLSLIFSVFVACLPLVTSPAHGCVPTQSTELALWAPGVSAGVGRRVVGCVPRGAGQGTGTGTAPTDCRADLFSSTPLLNAGVRAPPRQLPSATPDPLCAPPWRHSPSGRGGAVKF